MKGFQNISPIEYHEIILRMKHNETSTQTHKERHDEILSHWIGPTWPMVTQNVKNDEDKSNEQFFNQIVQNIKDKQMYGEVQEKWSE